jgi:uroporphyrinogen-III synthase
VRDAGATQVVVAATPDENALLEALERALRP